jgi:hypothetical protein
MEQPRALRGGLVVGGVLLEPHPVALQVVQRLARLLAERLDQLVVQLVVARVRRSRAVAGPGVLPAVVG